MNRRGFLGSLLGLALAPVAAKLPAAALPWKSIPTSVGLTGFIPWKFYQEGSVLNEAWLAATDFGSYENVRYIETRELSKFLYIQSLHG